MGRLILAAFLAIFGFATQAQAFGLKTHLWIGQQIIEDLKRDCSLRVETINADVPEEICQSIRQYPQHFLAGVLGPDAFPDLVTGQVTVHPGIEGDWVTSDWLIHVYDSAKPGPELAFAAGYLVHAASDTFAHSYVNGYAGDIFELTDERRVELRHFVLEKYIDKHLPAGRPNPSNLDVPASFLRDKLIFNDDAARVSRKSFAKHISAMWAVRESVGNVEREARNLEDDVNGNLTQIIQLHFDLSTKLVTGEAALNVAEESLRIREQQLAIERKAFEVAEKGLNAAIRAVDRNRDLINLYGHQADAARIAGREAHRVITNANNEIPRLEERASELTRKALTLDEYVTDKICSWKDICWKECLFGKCIKVCAPDPEWVCKPIRVLNKARRDLLDEAERARKKISRLRRDITQAQLDAAKAVNDEAAALHKKAAEEALTAQLNILRETAKASFDVVDLHYKAELALTKEAREATHKVREEVADLRERLLNTEKIKTALEDLVGQIRLLSPYFKNWREGMDTAGRQYILVGLDVSKGLAGGGSGDIMSSYRDWLKCYGSAFTPTPLQVSQAACAADSFITDTIAKMEALPGKLLPPPFNELYNRYMNLKDRLKAEVMDEAKDAAIELVKIASPDPATGEFIAVIADPSQINAGKLDEVFGSASDADGKRLLTFENASEMFAKDLKLKDGVLDPKAFAPLANATMMSKLALLDQTELRRVTWRAGGNPDRLALRGDTKRYSVLFQSLRSIDGNQQWQAYGVPYARSDDREEPENPKERHFGHGRQEGPTLGFPFFADPELRSEVFPVLFPKSNSGSLATRPELAPGRFPFPECAAHPFPITTGDDGSPAAEDPRCLAPDSDRPDRKPYSYRRSWRHFLEDLGLAKHR